MARYQNQCDPVRQTDEHGTHMAKGSMSTGTQLARLGWTSMAIQSLKLAPLVGMERMQQLLELRALTVAHQWLPAPIPSRNTMDFLASFIDLEAHPAL